MIAEMKRPLTRYEFEALAEWIEQRTNLLIEIARRPNDRPTNDSLRRRISELDALVRTILVEED